MASDFTFTWSGTAYDSTVFAFVIDHAEGEFALLKVDIAKPDWPLLSGELWATLAYHGNPIFHGRLVGVPADLQETVVQLQFLACPADYDAQKAAVAESLKVAPFWDPVFVAPEERSNPDAVLEARPALWHIDRVTNAVSVSDILAGEDGTIALTNALHESLSLSYGEIPAESISCTTELSWKQYSVGTLDLSGAIRDVFAAAGSTRYGYLTSYTGGGFMTDWPKSGTSIGGGWTVGQSNCWRLDGTGFDPLVLTVSVKAGGQEGEPALTAGYANFTVVDSEGNPIQGEFEITVIPPGNFVNTPNYYGSGVYGDKNYVGKTTLVGFPLWTLGHQFWANYEAERARKEVVTFTFTADVQPITVARDDARLDVELRSAEIDQPIDPGGELPIGDRRRNSYMLTDRGHRSLEYLICLCRSRLLARARCVTVACDLPFADGLSLSLRKSATITHAMLPGGVVLGKIVSYSLELDGDSGEAIARVALGCTVGRGQSLVVVEGVGDYVEEDYENDNYDVEIGGATVIETGGATAAAADIAYDDYDMTPVSDPVDLFNLTPESAILDLWVMNGSEEQKAVLLSSMPWDDSSAAMTALNDAHTQVGLALVNLRGDEIVTPFAVTVSSLMVPKTIDFENP